MIYIEKDSLNTICEPLVDAATILNPYFLFEFIKDVDGETIYWASADLSSYTNRYSLFELTESDAGGSGGVDTELKLKTGQYTYKVYQTEELTDDIDLVIGDAIKVGRMVVVGDNISNSIYN